MAALVIDASVAISAVLHEDDAEHARSVLMRVSEAGALVPGLWHLEVGQTLLVAERRRRIDRARRVEIQALLLDLPVTVDPETAAHALRDTALLAERHGLTLYDAAYLELSLRRGVKLATFDRDLRRAATEVGVALA